MIMRVALALPHTDRLTMMALCTSRRSEWDPLIKSLEVVEKVASFSCRSVCLFFCFSVFLSVSLSVSVCLSLSVLPVVCLVGVCLSLSVCQSISVCLPVLLLHMPLRFYR